MEGFMDVLIAAYRVGIENAVASMGNSSDIFRACPAPEQSIAKKIILSYDGIGQGQAATAKALDG